MDVAMEHPTNTSRNSGPSSTVVLHARSHFTRTAFLPKRTQLTLTTPSCPHWKVAGSTRRENPSGGFASRGSRCGGGTRSGQQSDPDGVPFLDVLATNTPLAALSLKPINAGVQSHNSPNHI